MCLQVLYSLLYKQLGILDELNTLNGVELGSKYNWMTQNQCLEFCRKKIVNIYCQKSSKDALKLEMLSFSSACGRTVKAAHDMKPLVSGSGTWQ